MKTDSIIAAKAYSFALDIIKLYKLLIEKGICTVETSVEIWYIDRSKCQ